MSNEIRLDHRTVIRACLDGEIEIEYDDPDFGLYYMYLTRGQLEACLQLLSIEASR